MNELDTMAEKARKLAKLPKAKARRLNRRRSIMGSADRLSWKMKTAKAATARMAVATLEGDVHPAAFPRDMKKTVATSRTAEEAMPTQSSLPPGRSSARSSART